jgi:hypothetical protein
MPYGYTLADWAAGGGTAYYWDPNNGNDGNSGLTIALARLTFASVYGLLTAGQGDYVVWVDASATSPSSGANTPYATAITLSKACTALFASGPRMAQIATTAASASVIISEEECVVSGLQASNATAGLDAFNTDASGPGSAFVNCVAAGTFNGHGFGINDEDVTLINCTARGNALNGFYIYAWRAKLIDCIGSGNSQDGFNVTSSGNESRLTRCSAEGNAGNGVELAGDDIVCLDCSAFGNGAAAWNDTGDGNHIAGGIRSDAGRPIR